jgi:hypothetical protein
MVGGLLALRNESQLVNAATKLRSPTTKSAELVQCSPDVWERARDIHDQLKSMAI